MRRRKYVHSFTDRHGRRRHYFRRPGHKQIPLPGLWGSPEFEAAYDAAYAGVTAPPLQIGAERTKPGTLNALIVGYYQSLAFRELAPGTQAMRRAIYERMRPQYGNDRVATMPPQFITGMLGRLKPHAARNWLKAIRALMAFAIAQGFRATDPTAGIRFKVPKSEGHHTWSLAEVATYEAYWANWHEAAARPGPVARHDAAPLRCHPHGPSACSQRC